MQISNDQLTDKLQAYIKKVEKETGRQVFIRTAPNVGLSGMKARFVEDPIYLIVEIVPIFQNSEEKEQSIAHEITHGHLAYATGYCEFTPTRELNELESNSISILVTMIEDIVVNKIIQANGFSPFASNYLDEVIRETKDACKKRDHYHEYVDPVFKQRFMVFRYILAWGFLHYCDLDEPTREILKKFEKQFKYSFPNQYKIASQIKEIILQFDIFTSEGCCQTIMKCLQLWGLDYLVIAKTYRKNVIEDIITINKLHNS